MGRRGPPPKPTALRLLQGNPGKRPINPREPQPLPGLPTCPAWVPAEARAIWKVVAPQLHAMGLLTRIDRDALVAYTVVYARWRKAEEFIAQRGEVYPLMGDDGRVKCMMPWPQVAIAKSLLHLLRGFAGEFGMTPASRSRVEVGSVVPRYPSTAPAGGRPQQSFADYLASIPQQRKPVKP